MIIGILYKKKRRAISPVIAVILLIGLAVAAVAAIFIVVLPLMQPTSDLEMTDAYVLYDGSFTKTVDHGVGYGKGSVILANAGTGVIKITEIKMYHGESSAGPWTEMTNALSLQAISPSEPFELEPLAINVELTMRFPIPVENIDSSRSYRMTVTDDDGKTMDTVKETAVNEEDMRLTKDRPDITPPTSIGTIRGASVQLSPATTPSDNLGGEVKNVTYEVYTNPSDPVGTRVGPIKTITSSPWKWNWDTLNSSLEGLDNGSYYVRMTVYDYAGLSDTHDADALPILIDNDYIDPTIVSVTGESVENGPDIAEVGSSYAIEATIIDSGSQVSEIYEAFIHYKLNDSSTGYYNYKMAYDDVSETWKGNIPGTFITSEALANNLTYYISAKDADPLLPGGYYNENRSSDNFADVNDSVEPNFYSHIFEGEEVTLLSTLVGDESLPLTIQVAVEDKDVVNSVTLVWREKNDSLMTPDPWQVLGNISGTGEVWEFRIPSINVTLDGLEYYLIALDPSNNTAYDGTPGNTYSISVEDLVAPVTTIVSDVPAKITADESLTITASVVDNDLSFSWTGSETGSMSLGYHRVGLDLEDAFNNPIYNWISMVHVQGDSSIGQTAIWQGTIAGGNFTTSYSPVLLQVQAEDLKGLLDFVDETVYVSAPGTPVLRYVEDSVGVSGGSNHILSFDVNNSAGGSGDPTATINGIEVTLTDNTKDPFVGNPLIIEVNGSGGTNPLRSNSSSPSEGTSGTKITLNNTIQIGQGSTITFDLTYANSSGGFFDVNDMTVNVTLYYTTGQETLELFDTPITTFQAFTQTRYMRSDSHVINGLSAYQWGTSQSSNFLELNEQSARWSGDLTVEWGIRVWIRHADSSETEVTNGNPQAVVTISSGDTGTSMEVEYWTPTPEDMVVTDSIVIRVYMEIGGTSYSPVEFTTEQLGAIKLLDEQWTIYYHTTRDYRGFPQTRTRGIFSWGDSSHDSRVTGIQFRALGGGGGSSIVSSAMNSSPGSSQPGSMISTDSNLQDYIIVEFTVEVLNHKKSVQRIVKSFFL